MENYRHVKTTASLVFAVAVFLLGPFFVLAYGTDTHSALTGETIEFFNSHFADKTFSAGEKEIVKRGSIDEDNGTRPLHHFYDPVYERGLFGFASSKIWAKATVEQAGFASVGLGSVDEFFSAESDYSWERAIYEYAWGDKSRGLEALGHILHLIQDASVPDHTRNDAHPPLFHFGSPYEGWAGKFNEETINVVSKLRNDEPVTLIALDEYFNNIASYSNNNFFSKDSIETYNLPRPTRIGSEVVNGEIILFAYGIDENKNEFRLAKVFSDPTKTDDFSIFIDGTSELLADYWSRLSKQAVLHGAGVIKLFFDEVEKEKETKTLYNKNKTWAQKIFDTTKDTIFNVAATFYGSSVTPADLDGFENNLATPPPSGQAAAVVALPTEEPKLETEPNPELEPEPEPQTENQEQSLGENVTENGPSGELLIETASEKTDKPNDQVRDQFGLVALPPGGGAIGGGGSSPPAEETESEEPEEEPADITPPDLAFDIAECSSSLTSGCLSTSTTAILRWSSNAEDLASYELNCVTGGAQCDDFPKTFLATSSVETAETLNDFTSYTFTLKAKDEAGNEKEISRQIETASLPVVINEIAWMGTASSSADEWIELKNNTSQEISLNGWTLRAQDGVPEISLSGKISANDYYLIERTDDDTVSDINGDLITAFSGEGSGSGLGNGGEHLFLERVSGTATTTFDEIALCGSSWCAGDGGLEKTMERIDPTSQGTSAANWATALGEFILNGKDASGSSVLGTPKSRNSANFLVNVSTTISSDKILTKERSPYLIGRNDIMVASGATLTIEAGAVVKFVSSGEPSLIINGTIKADGTTAEPVVFTAFADDEYGGDMNNDGICDTGNASSTASCPVAGSWKQILVNSSSQNSEFKNTVVRYGGWWVSSQTYKSAIAVDNTDVAFSGVTTEYSNGHGLWLQVSDSNVSNSIFKNNTKTDSALSPGAAGFRVAGGAPTISNNAFENNRYGLYIASAPQASVSSNTFTNNLTAAAESSGAVAAFSANSGSGNGFNAIILTGDITSSAVGTTTLKSNPIPYLVKNEVNVLASSTLTFDPQVVVKGHANFNNAAGRIKIKNGGKMFFAGTDASDLIFTSLYDDSAGGDTDNASNTPKAADWYGIVAEKGAFLDMAGLTLRYAGGLTTDSGNKAGIIISNNMARIGAAIVEKNFQNGILLDGVDDFKITGSTLRNHTEKGLGLSAAITSLGATTTLENITFSGNALDIKGAGDYSIDTTNCNCGSPTTDPNPL